MEQDKQEMSDVLAVGGKKASKAAKKTLKKVGKLALKALSKGISLACKGVELAGKAVQVIGKALQAIGQAVTAIPVVGKILGPLISAAGKGVEAIGKGTEAIAKQAQKITDSLSKKLSNKDSLLPSGDKGDLNDGLFDIGLDNIQGDIGTPFQDFQGTMEDIKYFINNESISFQDIKNLGNTEAGLDSKVFNNFMNLQERGCLNVNVNESDFSKSTFSVTDKGYNLAKEGNFTNATKEYDSAPKEKAYVKESAKER